MTRVPLAQAPREAVLRDAYELFSVFAPVTHTTKGDFGVAGQRSAAPSVTVEGDGECSVLDETGHRRKIAIVFVTLQEGFLGDGVRFRKPISRNEIAAHICERAQKRKAVATGA